MLHFRNITQRPSQQHKPTWAKTGVFRVLQPSRAITAAEVSMATASDFIGYDSSGDTDMILSIQTLGWEKKFQIAILTLATFMALC